MSPINVTDTPTDASSISPPPSSDALPSSFDPARALGWALYLGMSWTWVIGMFLPVLLIRDFGAWAWFAFAIPNVVGAAAMGWAIRSVEHGVRLVENHRGATRSFSLVTIAFHIYFLIWMVPKLLGAAAGAIAFGCALLVMARLFTTRLRSFALATIPLVVSLIVAMACAGRGSLGWPHVPAVTAPFEVLGLVGVCALGFVTCPYLDLTFHRARQGCRSEVESKIAFGVGFGVIFCAMIVFTLLYAGGMLRVPADRVLLALVGVHIAVQAIYTCGIHAAALRDTFVAADRGAALLWLCVAASALVGLGARWVETVDFHLGPLMFGEVIYRAFMSFYGLFAPAYVWLCVHPGRGFVRPHRSEWRMTVLACLLATPFYFIAFIYGPMTWVLGGVAIVVGARYALDYGRRDLLAEQRAAMLTQASPR